jgi:hypothetical protein
VDTDQKNKYLELVAQIHGDNMRTKCEHIIDEKEQVGEDVSLLNILSQAEEELYPSQVEASALAGHLLFLGDRDL